MDGKRAAPRKGRRVVFLGVCTCRAGPMCPAAGYAFFGRARGPRPTGQVRYPPVGDGVLQWGEAAIRFSFLGRRIPTPVFAPARNDRERADRVVHPYKLGMKGSTAALRHAHRVRSFIYWSRGGIYRATMWRRKLVSGDLRAGAGAGHPDRRRVSGGVPDVSGGVSADRLRRGVLA